MECSCAGRGTAVSGDVRVLGCTGGGIVPAVGSACCWPGGGTRAGAVGGWALVFEPDSGDDSVPGIGSGTGTKAPVYC